MQKCGDTDIKCTRGAAAESSSAGCRLPYGKKVSLSLSSVCRISATVPLLQLQWQEKKEAQYMLPDLASVAAVCLADFCGVVGEGANGRLCYKVCISRLGSVRTVMPKHALNRLCRSCLTPVASGLSFTVVVWTTTVRYHLQVPPVWYHLLRHHWHANCLTQCALCSRSQLKLKQAHTCRNSVPTCRYALAGGNLVTWWLSNLPKMGHQRHTCCSLRQKPTSIACNFNIKRPLGCWLLGQL